MSHENKKMHERRFDDCVYNKPMSLSTLCSRLRGKSSEKAEGQFWGSSCPAARTQVGDKHFT